MNDGLVDPKNVRSRLRDQEFEKWCELPQKGKGVELLKEYLPANHWIIKHEGLSSSEWRDAIKMTGNVAAVRVVPGRTMGNNRCRHCGNEIETLPHVLSSCPHGDALRNTRHHGIRNTITQTLRDNGYTVHEEVHGLSEDGSTRRIDMIAFQDNQKGHIIDPTIRFEHCKSQPLDVNQEKKKIYEPTISYYKSKYNLHHIEVIGLLVGARGTIPSFFKKFCEDFHLPLSFSKHIALLALKGSIALLRNHLR